MKKKPIVSAKTIKFSMKLLKLAKNAHINKLKTMMEFLVCVQRDLSIKVTNVYALNIKLKLLVNVFFAQKILTQISIIINAYVRKVSFLIINITRSLVFLKIQKLFLVCLMVRLVQTTAFLMLILKVMNLNLRKRIVLKKIFSMKQRFNVMNRMCWLTEHAFARIIIMN